MSYCYTVLELLLFLKTKINGFHVFNTKFYDKYDTSISHSVPNESYMDKMFSRGM